MSFSLEVSILKKLIDKYSKMLALNLPPYTPKIRKADNKVYIWDFIRKKYVILTPEEWVRQNFVNYLVSEKKYPASLISNEIQIFLNNRSKRCDTVIYKNNLQPLIIVEYKAPDVQITQQVFDQIARYNIVLRVNYLIVSNGIKHFCCKINYETNSYVFLAEIPEYNSICD